MQIAKTSRYTGTIDPASTVNVPITPVGDLAKSMIVMNWGAPSDNSNDANYQTRFIDDSTVFVRLRRGVATATFAFDVVEYQ